MVTTLNTAEQYEKKQFDPCAQNITPKTMKSERCREGLEDAPPDPETQKDLKTLYKKIAAQTLPDKLINEQIEAARKRKQRLFMEAREALENKDYYKLSQIAEELNIGYRSHRQQLVWMRKKKEN